MSGALRDAGVNLVAGWLRSGILTCSVTLYLKESEKCPPGIYLATLNLDLRIR